MAASSAAKDADIRIQIGDRITITRRGKKGTYYADFNFSGRHTRRSLKTSNQKIARQRAVQLEADLADGEYSTRRKAAAVADAKNQFIAHLNATGRAYKTIVAYQSEIETFTNFLHTHGVQKLPQIEARHFLDYRASRKSLAEKTLYTRSVIVKTFINWCCGDGDLRTNNPFRRCKVRAPFVPPKFTPTLSDVDAVLAKAGHPRSAQLATLAFTGLRVGELAMLRPQDVDLVAGAIHVVARDGWVPKTRQARKIPIHPRLKSILAEYQKTLAGSADRGYFFSDKPDGSRPINVRTINVDLQKIAKALSIRVGRKLNGIVVHSLRHLFETQAVDSGVPQFAVDQWMGHAGQQLRPEPITVLATRRVSRSWRRCGFNHQHPCSGGETAAPENGHKMIATTYRFNRKHLLVFGLLLHFIAIARIGCIAAASTASAAVTLPFSSCVNNAELPGRDKSGTNEVRIQAAHPQALQLQSLVKAELFLTETATHGSNGLNDSIRAFFKDNPTWKWHCL